jgi:hypothetical protein
MLEVLSNYKKIYSRHGPPAQNDIYSNLEYLGEFEVEFKTAVGYESND